MRRIEHGMQSPQGKASVARQIPKGGRDRAGHFFRYAAAAMESPDRSTDVARPDRPLSPEQLTGTITSLLREARGGKAGALDELFAVVYDDLRRLAQRKIGDVLGPGRGHGASGTALLHAACERLLGRGTPEAEDRRHFYFLLSRAMHDVLVEEVRAAQALRRGGGHERVPFVEFAGEGGPLRLDVLAVREALEALREVDPEGAQVVMLRFFAGRTLEECAALMGCPFAEVRRHWDYARAWLHERLDAREEEPGAGNRET
jgi:RNA polymerase sigma factor (TIGR02999 family)